MPTVSRPPISALLIDLSGTLHVGSSPTPGAVNALSRLRRSNNANHQIPFRFCSNTSKEGRVDLERRLQSMGFELQHTSGLDDSGKGREMWTSLGALNSQLRKKRLVRPFCLLEQSSKEEVLCGLSGASSSSDSKEDYDSVVVGLAPSLFTYEHLNTAFRVLLDHKPLIATHRAKYIRSSSSSSNDTLSLGPGPFVAALENAAGVKAEAVGKPSRAFFEAVIDSFHDSEISHNSEGKVVIIGDDVETDLGGGAVELGLWRVLVKTGKYRPGDEDRLGVTPADEVWDTFADFVDSLLGPEDALT